MLLDTVVHLWLRVQVDDEHFYDGPDDSDYETDYSDGISRCLFFTFTVNLDHYWLKTNSHLSDVDTSGIDYPAKFSEEEGSECESEERKHDSSCNELSDENI